MPKKIQKEKTLKIIAFFKRISKSKFFKPSIFIILIIIGLVPRLVELFNNFDYLTVEPAIDYISAKQIAIDHFFPTSGYVHGGHVNIAKIAWDYLLSVPFALSGGHPFSLKILMFAMGVATIIFTFILFKSKMRFSAVIIITFLIAISPMLIEYSGKISPPYALPTIMVFFLYSLFRFFSGNTRYIYVIGLLIGLVFHFEIPAAMLLVIQFILIFLYCVKKRLLTFKQFLLTFALTGVMIIPTVIFNLHETSEFFLKNTSDIGYSFQFSNIINRLGTFSWNFRASLIPNGILAFFLMILILIGSMRMYLDKKIDKTTKSFVIYLVLSPVLFYLVSIFSPQPISGWWLSFIVVYYCFLLGVILDYFFQVKKLRIYVISIICIMSILFLNRSYQTYSRGITFPHRLELIRTYPIVKYLYDYTGGRRFEYEILSYHKPRNKVFNYDGMIWWLGKNSKLSAKEKLIILESDYQEPLQLQRLKESKAQIIKSFPNGVVILRID